MRGYLYLIRSYNCKRPYLGSCFDVEKRIKEHNCGKNKSTKGKGPWLLDKCWVFDDIVKARKAEYTIKKMKIKLSAEFIEKLVERPE
ncbi:MAG TPA: endonuclease [Candidatus Magasanikbacteria bacterium]|nr:endonuclease [Candidatus Magasanikbacteria bacterium]